MANSFQQSSSVTSIADETPMAIMHPSQFGFRAVQRLSSYSLLLHGLIRKTSEDHIDYTKLQKAYKLTKDIAKSVNESIQCLQNHTTHMELIKYLDFCPDKLKTSTCKLNCHLQCISINSVGKQDRRLQMYIFETCIEIGKLKICSRTVMSPKPKNNQINGNIIQPNHLNSYGSLNFNVNKIRHQELIDMANIKHLILIDDV